MLSFTDDILDEIKIKKCHRIAKPGKNPEIGKIVDDNMMKILCAMSNKDPEQQNRYLKARRVQDLKDKTRLKRKSVMSHITKGQMQAKNHGR